MHDNAPTPYRIDRVDPSTFDDLLPLIADYQRFYGCEPDESRNRRFFGDMVGDDTHGLQLLARHGDRAAGFTTLYWTRVSTRATTVALLNDLFVHPDHRGGRRDGLGTLLLRAAAREAAARGYRNLVWQTAPDNTAAQALYDRFLADASAPGSTSGWIEYSCPLPYEGER
ncbi:GNAT family N-acetyltransferase [Streptomyces sudanensis]|uniref:GNAT family N-acetyltransferase n=1 Tax=Streptomyces sudanensis TaxID=436397 RepID=UPI0020CDEB2E|nr:GNAT family N-acetyltransferase [Streptomyces sudanensis]MCP9999685.1 GNAT family N-acetyltransferase [Streptomyces sudanensis]